MKELAPKHLIIRSSWVYGMEGHNFVNSIIEQAKNGGCIEAAVDDYACPTSAKELSRVILRLIKEEQEGIYHAVCGGSCSRYELAEEILRLMGKTDVRLEAKKMVELQSSIDGPEYTILDNMMLRMSEIETPVPWKEALKEYLQEYDCQRRGGI